MKYLLLGWTQNYGAMMLTNLITAEPEELLEECVTRCFEDVEEIIHQRYTKATPHYSAGKCFHSARSVEAFQLTYYFVWIQPFDVSCYIK